MGIADPHDVTQLPHARLLEPHSNRKTANRLGIFKYPTLETDQAQSKLGISLLHSPERHRGTCTGVW